MIAFLRRLFSRKNPLKTYHKNALPVLIMNAPEKWIKANVIPRLTKSDGSRPSVGQVKAMCAIAKGKGFEVLPPCDKVDSKGRCRGHLFASEG